MTPSLALAAAGLFAIVLLLLRTRDKEAQERANGEGTQRIRCGFAGTLQPAELAIRIFSQVDKEFILLLDSPELQQLYREERRKVALHWVRRTSREVSQIIRHHRFRSRKSVDLNAAVETKLFLQYLELRLLCGALLLLIQLFGPHVLVNVAARAGKLYQQIGRAMPELTGANQAASPGSIAAL